MVINLLSTAFVASLSLSIANLRESRNRLIRLFADANDRRGTCNSAVQQVQAQMAALPYSDPISELSFTRSLLALSTIGLQARDGSPEPGSVESSSLVSVRHAQSKSPDRAL